MNNDAMEAFAAAAVLAIARNASELAPYLAVLALGFLVGAWGQSARAPAVVVAGLLLILLAVGAFIIEHSGGTGGSGIPGLGGN
jgi:uncharacterized membrane protein YfbV (UPF0208 family)